MQVSYAEGDKTMTVKIRLIDGDTEVFVTEHFVISPVKSWRPDIMSVRVYDTGAPVAGKRRPFPLCYRLFVWPRRDVQEAMARIRSEQAQENNP